MKLFNGDCIKILDTLESNSVGLTLTDIPYDEVNRKSNGLKDLDKKNADELTFELSELLPKLMRVTKGTIIIFCGMMQVSDIIKFFRSQKGTTRLLIWEKTNPSPMNCDKIYMSGIECAVWFKKPNATFNAHYKNTVFRHPNGRRKYHPTEKNMKLMEELILDNSNENDTILDCCAGSGTVGVASKKLNRDFIGIELDEEYFKVMENRLK